MFIDDRSDAIKMLGYMDIDTSAKTEDEINDPIRNYLGIDYSIKPPTVIDFDKVVIPVNTTFSELYIGPTPSGGEIILYYYNEEGSLCKKKQGKYCQYCGV